MKGREQQSGKEETHEIRNPGFFPMVVFFVSERVGAAPFRTDPYQPVHESWERFGAVFSRVVMHTTMTSTIPT